MTVRLDLSQTEYLERTPVAARLCTGCGEPLFSDEGHECWQCFVAERERLEQLWIWQKWPRLTVRIHWES